ARMPFRPPVLSGGMDSQLVLWSSRTGRSLAQFDAGTELSPSVSGSDAKRADRFLNPPFVHHLTVSPDGNAVPMAHSAFIPLILWPYILPLLLAPPLLLWPIAGL